jgi:pentatricopeptide repeat protein
MIKSLGIEENAELCMSIGDAYCECAQWDEALDFYHELAENDSVGRPPFFPICPVTKPNCKIILGS